MHSEVVVAVVVGFSHLVVGVLSLSPIDTFMSRHAAPGACARCGCLACGPVIDGCWWPGPRASVPALGLDDPGRGLSDGWYVTFWPVMVLGFFCAPVSNTERVFLLNARDNQPLPWAALLLILAFQAKFGVPRRVSPAREQRRKSCGCRR